MVWSNGSFITCLEVSRLGLSEVSVHFHESKKFSSFTNRKHACSFCYEKISQQVINNFRSLEIDDKNKTK